MGKDSKKQPKQQKGLKLETSQQSKAYVEQVKKELKINSIGYETKLVEATEKTEGKTYLSTFMKPTGNTFVNFTHTLDNLDSNTYEFDPKQLKDHHFNPKNRAEEIKDMYTDPVTSNQVYGWRAPIDVFPTGHGLKSTLVDHSSKPSQKPKKK